MGKKGQLLGVAVGEGDGGQGAVLDFLSRQAAIHCLAPPSPLIISSCYLLLSLIGDFVGRIQVVLGSFYYWPGISAFQGWPSPSGYLLDSPHQLPAVNGCLYWHSVLDAPVVCSFKWLFK